MGSAARERNGKILHSWFAGLQPPKGAYDVMWFQWVLGHLPDDDLIAMFDRCREGLAPRLYHCERECLESGFVLDKEDMSVTRSLAPAQTLLCRGGVQGGA